MSNTEKRAPVQGYPGGIPWAIHLEAYEVYCKRWGAQPALIDLEGRNCRGGFSTGELDDFIPGWRDRVAEFGLMKTEVTQLRTRVDDYATEINRLRNVIQAACTGGLGYMIERWKVLFPDAPVPTVQQQSDDWRQYATEREDTAQQVIERHRAEHDSLLRLLAQARTEQGRAYRCIQGMHNALHTGKEFSEGYHAPTIGAAKRFVFEDAIDGSDYFIGKPVEVLHAALALPNA